jgi:ATP-dependent Lon protease
VLIPSDNEKHLGEIPDNVKAGLEIIPVSTVDDVLAKALAGPLTPIEWTDEDEVAEDRRAAGAEDREGARPH